MCDGKREREREREREQKREEWSDSARTRCTAAQKDSCRSNNFSFLEKGRDESIFCDVAGDNERLRLLEIKNRAEEEAENEEKVLKKKKNQSTL